MIQQLVGLLIAYSFVVAASIYFLGKPSLILGDLSWKTFYFLLIDWRFLLGGSLALGARFMFVVINNLAAKIPSLSGSHLTVSALATTGSLLVVVLVNHFFLGERLSLSQMIGGIVTVVGISMVLR
ncbi:MAG: hypothetical protein HYZ62_01610 [Candidatus Andersenbacteria bacterium]|nr:hypothetical protein [Candidatus Andersenbacteria bacterium]